MSGIEELVPDELTPEEEAEWSKFREEASETEPPELTRVGEDPEDPPQIDRRTAAERLQEDVDEPADTEVDAEARERDEKGRFKARETETEAETKPAAESEPVVKTDTSVETRQEKQPQDTPHDGDPDADWFRELPPEAKRHFRGLKGETARLREQRRRGNDAVSNLQKQVDAIPDLIKQAVAEANKPPPPDPDLDPDGYRRHLENQTKTYEQQVKEAQDQQAKQQQEEREFQELVMLVQESETDFAEEHPDYYDAINHAKKAAAQYFIDELGVDPAVAEARVLDEIKRTAVETRQLGGNIAHRFYRRAVTEFGWGQQQTQPGATPSGGSGKAKPNDAETIARGQKAARGLGTGGGESGVVGPMTIDRITELWKTDPDKAALEYENWARRQIEGE